jgi:hypothetical protein
VISLEIDRVLLLDCAIGRAIGLLDVASPPDTHLDVLEYLMPPDRPVMGTTACHFLEIWKQWAVATSGAVSICVLGLTNGSIVAGISGIKLLWQQARNP